LPLLTGQEEVRKYQIPDFSNWKNHDAFERAFAAGANSRINVLKK